MGGGAEGLEVVKKFRGWADGSEIVQMVYRWCRWFIDGADDLEVVQII